MDTRAIIEAADSAHVLSVAFNSDATCFAAGLDSGLSVFHTKTCLMKASRDFNAGLSLVQMMGSTNFLALVGGGRRPKFANNKVIIWDDHQCKPVIEISTLTPVRGVQLGRSRIVVVLNANVRVYTFAKPPTLICSYETADNPLGLCVLTERFVAFPGRTPGHIQLVDLGSSSVSIIPAHSSALRALALSADSDLLASASETGTILRVWSTSNCAKLAELRRGIDPARIFSMAFNPEGNMLAATSDKATLHIFDVPHPRKPQKRPTSADSASSSSILPGLGDGDGKGKWGILSRLPMMPRVFSDTYSFASTTFEAGCSNRDSSNSTNGLGMGQPHHDRAHKGIIGWISEDSLVVVGAGHDARWEKFGIRNGEEGRRVCVRESWKRYLGHM